MSKENKPILVITNSEEQKNFTIFNTNNNQKYILEGVFTRFASKSYPNIRDYNKYIWDEERENWVINKLYKKFEDGEITYEMFYKLQYGERHI